MASAGGTIPASLRPISHYVNIAKENASRDPVVYYWCLFYAVQTGMNLDKKSEEAFSYLTSLVTTLEKVIKLAGQEAISQDIVAQAHIENFAMKLFEYADKNDRQSVIKAFYTAGYLIDVLTLFGELDENLVVARKYSKWKAAYICNCLKKGEKPVPGPVGGTSDDLTLETSYANSSQSQSDSNKQPSNAGSNYTDNSRLNVKPVPEPRNLTISSSNVADKTNSDKFNTADILEAQKFAKYAVSALSYEDTKTAIENLEKAMAILKKF
uniref:Vacuolar protein sorting-associated protein VTA1 n=1 Tax=Syphacia muris TaxID=451379 RepID=A0A0N5AZF5_9BILA